VIVSCMAAGLSAQGDPAAEILAARARISQAVQQKDRATLERLFTDDFTHTHAIGRMDSRARRMKALASGEATVDSVTADEIQVRFYGPDRSTAVAVGQSTVGTARYRWTVVYIKGADGWRAAASHASPMD
jgi:ketosteroid isomerase-like protein